MGLIFITYILIGFFFFYKLVFYFFIESIKKCASNFSQLYLPKTKRFSFLRLEQSLIQLLTEQHEALRLTFIAPQLDLPLSPEELR